jgi:hypothetical protein
MYDIKIKKKISLDQYITKMLLYSLNMSLSDEICRLKYERNDFHYTIKEEKGRKMFINNEYFSK